MKRLAVTVTAVSLLALGACSKKAPEQLPPPPAAPVQTAAPVAAAPQAPGMAPGSQGHFRQAMSGRDVIYFDTDQYNVDAEDAAALRQQAQYLLQYPNARARLEGHADERGTREYNLALGERRANAAKNYLIGLGIPATRLTTISYGKERPDALGSNESSWARNRRAVTVVVE
ncbi:peptidoglycan-associated lipoprotein Pal [Altericroceibacterium xinjiangense]|uniref:peptidoglycan-associated lipoprotein Pal n=1 Tax=Altericroceibacterium xinjiangense TaxID=762261 RepID=UPI000F7F5D3C|nr:peptidoglycan-associated lipoprotein Pal [Altericroceibacterium xinjiangense]